MSDNHSTVDQHGPESRERLCLRRNDLTGSFFGKKGEWSAILQSLEQAPFFLGPEWLGIWWQVYSRERQPMVLTAHDNDTLVGALPLTIGRLGRRGLFARQISWMGSGERVCPEHLDLIAAGDEIAATAAKLAAGFVSRNVGHWDLIRLSDSLPEGFSSDFQRIMKTQGYETRREVCSICPRIDLPNSFDELLASYSHNQRRSIRRTSKRLRITGRYQVKWWGEGDHLGEMSASSAISHMTRLHTLSRSIHGDQGNFADQMYAEFHKLMLTQTCQTGKLRLAFLYHSEAMEPIAFRYGFLQDSIWLDYQTGYDPSYQKQRIGWHLLAECVNRAINDGAIVFDMLRGDHPYKRHWANATRETETVWVFNHTPRGVLLRHLLRLKRLLRP